MSVNYPCWYPLATSSSSSVALSLSRLGLNHIKPQHSKAHPAVHCSFIIENTLNHTSRNDRKLLGRRSTAPSIYITEWNCAARLFHSWKRWSVHIVVHISSELFILHCTHYTRRDRHFCRNEKHDGIRASSFFSK